MDEYGGHDRDDDDDNHYGDDAGWNSWSKMDVWIFNNFWKTIALLCKYKCMQFVSFPFQCSPIVHLEFDFYSYLFLHLPIDINIPVLSKSLCQDSASKLY